MTDKKILITIKCDVCGIEVRRVEMGSDYNDFDHYCEEHLQQKIKGFAEALEKVATAAAAVGATAE